MPTSRWNRSRTLSSVRISDSTITMRRTPCLLLHGRREPATWVPMNWKSATHSSTTGSGPTRFSTASISERIHLPPSSAWKPSASSMTSSGVMEQASSMRTLTTDILTPSQAERMSAAQPAFIRWCHISESSITLTTAGILPVLRYAAMRPAASESTTTPVSSLQCHWDGVFPRRNSSPQRRAGWMISRSGRPGVSTVTT